MDITLLLLLFCCVFSEVKCSLQLTVITRRSSLAGYNVFSTIVFETHKLSTNQRGHFMQLATTVQAMSISVKSFKFI